MKSSSRSFVPILVICGVVIGGVLTYLVFSSIFFLGKESIPNPQKNWSLPTAEENNEQMKSDLAALYPFSSTTTASVDSRDMAHVEWTAPTELTRKQMFDVLQGASSNPEQLKKILDVETSDFGISNYSGPPTDVLYPDGSFIGVDRMWKQGVIRDGEFTGATVYLIRLNGWNMGPGVSLYQIIRSKDGRQLFLSKSSDGRPSATSLGIDTIQVETDLIKLFGTVATPKLHVNEREFELTGSIVWGGEYIFDSSYSHTLDSKAIVVTDEGVSLYKSSDPYSSGCLAAILDSGLIVHYTAVIASQEGFGPKSGSDLGVVWNREYENETKYLGKVFGGCGGGYCANVVSSTLVGDESNLVIVGMVKGTGDSIYAPKDPMIHPLVKEAYDRWYDPSSVKKPTMEEMMDRMKVPVFFWKDPIGRWVEYGADSLIPQAECGKPVIYLYPEKQTDVRVALPKFINVTVSDPVYPSKGWNVTANPNGDLVSKADGKTYGSLYWEGTGVGYQPPTTGFVIKSTDVTSTLASLLTEYGLNQKESFEFMEFWLPEFSKTKAPYFRVSFLTDEWSKAAPLSVFPRPRTSIRVFMDWQALSAPISIPEPKITTPERDGFTLVEWGGTLYK